MSGTEVEDAGFMRVVEEIHIHLDHVFDRDEIAQLPSVWISVAALEQFHPPICAELVEEVIGDRCHASLVRFARAGHVEIPQADYLCIALMPAAAHDLVE